MKDKLKNKIKEHFDNPRNIIKIDEINNILNSVFTQNENESSSSTSSSTTSSSTISGTNTRSRTTTGPRTVSSSTYNNMWRRLFKPDSSVGKSSDIEDTNLDDKALESIFDIIYKGKNQGKMELS